MLTSFANNETTLFRVREEGKEGEEVEYAVCSNKLTVSEALS